MDSTHWQHLLQKYRAIAVIRCSEVKLGLSMAKAVAQGGMRLIEITWNSEQPAQLISQLRTDLPQCIIGTGTILTLEDLKGAIACGSQFCFTPHVNLSLISAAIEANLPIIPGALTPTEIINAWQGGASCVKVFPAPMVGGASYIKTLQGPLGQIPLIPTGGITLENAKDYLDAGAIAVGLSSDLFPKPLLASQDWTGISQRSSKLNQTLNLT
ncbi:2-dehydro-3-deoxyphosphogluconate aldolase/4-hydroxy-2-oxoglutarate aldolase [Gloeothece citriformis PCC 7424]|uniref:2-dehydro-3-deoxyphosphogluconate aldolase/4-hydroxy-2-oxoglutarate aldolase n=1 Tax=Gloeothece citriformis (strain PCC 7424) TaxID=65393 RepID=B7KAY6_GLOC7|nr:bifunctional 4-hydroxy-2-oxoglutarate aldolase/2-dehydro-3-deoxy-phosphogluconate aldolase [Gloeothece citriformis]ACK70096.1 2-dehydro-3-deoxyphosphogluconate aldolase/4-hydroxy-2-oxoglutarate aldolase [Gloeothece citriformis PCC 7424]